jgi:hypothetical protein
VAVVAPTRSTATWSEVPSDALDVESLDASARAALAQAWEREGASEHASVASFARLSLHLIALGAPADIIDRVLLAAREEVAHAKAAYGIASRFAGVPRGPGPLEAHDAGSPVDYSTLAIGTFRDGCVGETVAALEAEEAGRRAGPREIRSALARIARDESEHALLAWRILAWALQEGGAAARHAVAHEITALTRELRDLAGEDRVLPGDPPDESYGILRERTARSVRRVAIERVVEPCADALLAEV